MVTFSAPHNLIHRHARKHSHPCLVFREKLWKRQLWWDGERHAGLTRLWSRANCAHRLRRWSSTQLTHTDGNGLLICLASGLTTHIRCTDESANFCIYFHFLFRLHCWILKGLMKKYITRSLLCNACIAFQTAKTGVSGIWPMSIPGFRRSQCQPGEEKAWSSLNVAIY